MMVRTDWLRNGALLSLGLIVLLGSCQFREDGREISHQETEPLIVRSNYHDDRLMWDHIVTAKEPLEIDDDPRGVIIPHHAMVSRDIASVYSGLAQKINPKTIFLLSPNHFELSEDSIVTGQNLRWETVYGDLEPDRELVNSLIDSGLAIGFDQAFPAEHGVFIHSPLIKHFFPQAKIIPILFHWKNDRKKNDRIAKWLYENMDEDSFIIASVDFSHYQPQAVADFHDEGTEISITGFMADAVYDREIDSPSSVYTLMKLMEMSGSTRAVRLQHTNSDRVLGYWEPMTTSHQYYVFYDGEAERVSGFTVLVGGEQLQESEKILSREYWEWDRDAPIPAEGSDLLANLRGLEDRFFMGADLILLALPLGKDELYYQFYGGALRIFPVDENSKDDSRLSVRIREAADRGDEGIMIVYETSLDDGESAMGNYRQWAGAGAHVIIRRGPGPYDRREHRGTLIISGLGPFTGGEDVDDAQMIGLVFRNGSVSARELPLLIRDGLPEYKFSNE